MANVVRLALYARRDEIEIMQLVGAPQAYIRGPFVMEGVLRAASARWSRWRLWLSAFLALRGRYLVAAGRGRQSVVGAVPVARAVRCCCWSAACWSAASAGCVAASGRDLTALQNLDTRFRSGTTLGIIAVDNSLSRTCMPRFVTDSRPISAQHPLTEFYREEFVKHQRCLQQQRPYYSESAITDVEAALTRIMGQLEQLCSKDNADELVSSLLKKFDVVTGLSAWSDPKHTH